VKGPSRPAAPSGLTATAVDPHDIGLKWTDKSSNETGF
jgi:large repetitive protein